MARSYRSQKFSNKGSYVHVYQRSGEDVMLDINFFDGDRQVSEISSLIKTLKAAYALAKVWRDEK